MRRDLAQRLGFAPDALDGRMDEIKELMREVVAELQDGEDGAFKTGRWVVGPGPSGVPENEDHVANSSYDSEGTRTSMEFHWLCSPNNLPACLPTSTVHPSSALLKACALRIGRSACNAPLLP